jgi:hypothetical protein
VHEALKSTGEQCAVKIFKGADPEPAYEHEKKALIALRGSSPYLAAYEDAFKDQTSGCFCIIMPR